MAVTRIEGVEQARALGARLNGNQRTKPLVLVSTSTVNDAPWIDVDRVADELDGLAEVYLVVTGPDTFALSDTLPPQTQVYGGAGRAYPLGHAWASDLRQSPLRFAHDARAGTRATEALITDALGMVASTGRSSAPRPGLVPAQGVVKGLAGGRAVVALADRTLVSVVPELAVPGVPVERLLTQGMTVIGTADLLQRRLHLGPSLRSVEQMLGHVEIGQLVLTRVVAVAEAEVVLAVVPGVDVAVDRDHVTGNQHDDLRSLFTEGEVLPARVAATGSAAGDWSLTLLDVDDDETPLPAPSLLPGGPAWLLATSPDPAVTLAPDPAPEPAPEPEPETEPVAAPTAAPPRPSPRLLDPRRREQPVPLRPAAPAPRPTAPAAPAVPAAPAPRPPATVLARQQSLTIEELKARVRTLEQHQRAVADELLAVGEQLTAAQAETARLRGDLKRLRTENRKRTQQQRRPEVHFLDPDEQFLFDLHQAWARRIPASDKAARPLAHVDLAPGFVATVDALEGVSRSKVLDVAVEVATGLAEQVPGRDLHRLRHGASGGSGYVERHDGAQAMRCALQVNSPGARRLHYWRRLDGGVELVKVVHHDDMTM